MNFLGLWVKAGARCWAMWKVATGVGCVKGGWIIKNSLLLKLKKMIFRRDPRLSLLEVDLEKL